MFAAARRTDERQLISSSDLEIAIAGATKQSDPDCNNFVGVIVERVWPISRWEPNWAIKGIRFGKSDRQKAEKAIAAIVVRMQSEFKLSNGA